MRDKRPLTRHESREAKAAAEKRAAQNARVANAADAIKAAFVSRRRGQDVQDQVWGGPPPPEPEAEPQKD